MVLSPLPAIMTEPIIRNALLEDLGLAGDITTNAVIPSDHHTTVVMVARQYGVVAGVGIAAQVFNLLDRSVAFEILRKDGDTVDVGETIAVLQGPSHAILTGERTALNFISHLSGIASVTRQIANAIRHTKAQIVCTRKTTPGLRMLEKYAVRAGGGMNHRYALSDALLIKDNHIAIAGGITAALDRARTHSGHMVKIEIEVDTLEQLDEALKAGADAVLLDNMTLDMLNQAVARVAGRALTEASGRITPQTAPAIAESGVDLISAGWITHSAPILDIGFDFVG